MGLFFENGSLAAVDRRTQEPEARQEEAPLQQQFSRLADGARQLIVGLQRAASALEEQDSPVNLHTLKKDIDRALPALVALHGKVEEFLTGLGEKERKEQGLPVSGRGSMFDLITSPEKLARGVQQWAKSVNEDLDKRKEEERKEEEEKQRERSRLEREVAMRPERYPEGVRVGTNGRPHVNESDPESMDRGGPLSDVNRIKDLATMPGSRTPHLRDEVIARRMQTGGDGVGPDELAAMESVLRDKEEKDKEGKDENPRANARSAVRRVLS